MAKAFRLKAGIHVVCPVALDTENQTLARPGAIIVSNSDLIAQNGADKFELVKDEDIPGDAIYDRGVEKPAPAAESEVVEGDAKDGKKKKTVA